MKKLLTIIALMLIALTASAQAYVYEHKIKENGWYECFTNDNNMYRDNTGELYHFFLDAQKDSYCVVGFVTRTINFESKNKGIKLSKKEKDFPIQFKLSNGYILKSDKLNSKHWDVSFWISSGGMTINNRILDDKSYQDAMSLLRTYDIVAITVEGITVNTPGLRSADTFDAMCKTLISKTGDQGQYGKRLTGGNQTTTQRTPSKPAISTPSTNRTQQNNRTTNPSNSQSNTPVATTSANTQISTKYRGIRMLYANSDNYNPNKTTSNDFSAYDLSTKVLGIISNPSVKMNIEDIVNGLLSYMPNLKMELRNSLVYDFKNMEISCNGKNLIYNIKFNSDYSLKSFAYYAYFQTKEEAIAYMKKIQAELESQKISFNIGRGDAIFTDYKYYPNSISISVNKNKDKEKSKMKYVLWWFCYIKK